MGHRTERIRGAVREYPIPMGFALLGLCGLLAVVIAVYRPDVTVPPWLLPTSAAALILAGPSWLLGWWISSWFDTDERVWVGIADPGTACIYDGKKVDRDLWDARAEVAYPALTDPDGCFDAVVTRFEYYEAINEVEVRGVAPELQPATAWRAPEQVDDLHDHYGDLKRRYSNLTAHVSDYATEIHDAAIMSLVAQREDASLAGDVTVSGLVEDMEDGVDDLPAAPEPELEPAHIDRQGLGELSHDQVTGALGGSADE